MSNLAITVPFHGSNLFIVTHNGQPYTPMKPVVEGMGLDWKSQFSKIKQRFAKGMVEITIPTKGGSQAMICLAMRKLAGWLHTISPNKVKPEIRDTVIRYQEECDDVLYEYWMNGEVKKKADSKIVPNGYCFIDEDMRQHHAKQLTILVPIIYKVWKKSFYPALSMLDASNANVLQNRLADANFLADKLKEQMRILN